MVGGQDLTQNGEAFAKRFSFLLPTRGNPSRAQRFLQSVCDTADDPTGIEVILAVDEDDPSSHGITCDGLAMKTVILPPGLTMGNLNRACFEASSGRYVMLINDDVIVRSQGWDTTIYRTFAQYQDDIAIVHVNDLLFREKFCTFPILSRKACLAIGICPDVYRRYRIDDHIYDTYYLLSYLGHNRLIYVDDLVFEHDNYAHKRPQTSDNVSFFESDEGKVYIPQPEIFEADSRAFNDLFEERKRNARLLAGLIENAAESRKQATYAARLKSVKDSYVYRPQCAPVRRVSSAAVRSESPRVTVAVVTSDLRKPHARKCLSLVKKHTSNFDLVVLDNGGSRTFNHASEMNRVLNMATTDYVVLLDDDVFVSPGWLDGMLAAVDDQTAVVTPLHHDGRGRMSYSGVYLLGDGTGRHAHTIDVPNAPRATQCICSAAMLIDRRKCEGIYFDANYRKYYFDLVYALRVWEAGYRVVCTPASRVVHLGGGTMSWRSAESMAAADHDSALFVATWIANGRLDAIQSTAWRQYDHLQKIEHLQREARDLFLQCNQVEWKTWQGDVERVLSATLDFPLFRENILGQLHHWKDTWYVANKMDRVVWAESIIDRYATGSRLRRFAARIKRKLKRTIKHRVIPALKNSPAIHHAASSARCHMRNVYHHYLRMPPLIRRPMDPFIRFAKQSASPLLRVAPEVRLGMYKGHWLLQVGTAYQTVPVRRENAATRARSGYVLTAASVSKLTAMIDATDAQPTGPPRLQQRLSADAERPIPLGEYQGVRLLAFEGRCFGLTNGHPFDPEKLRSCEEVSCLVGHSIDDIRSQVDELKKTNGQGRSASVLSDTASRAATKTTITNGHPTAKLRSLLVCTEPTETPPADLGSLLDEEVTLFAPEDYTGPSWGMPILHYPQWTPGDLHLQERPRHFLETLGQSRFDRFVLPYSGEAFWKGTGFEQMAAACARQLDILQPDGESRTYRGEDIHRIIYNKSYLASLLAHTTVQGKRVLDVGCSDGLACDLLLHERPESITGVDVMKTVGCVYHDPRISYHTRDAAHLDFADASFDVCYSIATLEHCEDPYRVLQEIRRVTKPGGVAYVQAGPLYYSPFGHHMFGYFDDFPWIHLRRDFNGILDYCREKGIADRIRQTLHRAPEEYVADMLNVRHINGLAFHEYRVTEFLESNDIEVLSFSRSTEGEKLITRELAEEMDTVPVEDLLSHGFELAFRRK